MKKSKLIGWAFIALATITSCSEDTDVLSQESEIKLTSEIAPSRVTALDYQSTQIVAGQQVGVTITGATTSHNNVVWSVGENGALTNTGDKVYYGAGSATITAYHPYNSASSSYTFSVNTDQSSDENYSNSDLLWTTTTSSKTETAVPLTFTHKLAKINVTLDPEKAGTDLSGATISICNTKISTTFDPTTGVISDASGDSQEIKAGVTTEGSYTASAIVVPQTVNSGSPFIKIAHGGKTFYYSLSANKELKSGYSHNYKLTVKEQKVVALGESVIANWTAEEEEIADAEEVYETLLLPDGLTFNEIVGEYLTANPSLKKIKFITNSDVTSESILVTDDDGTKGYLVANEEWLEIHTYASEFVANGDCMSMFAGNYEATSPFCALTHIDLGNKFNTSNVTNMGGMFVYCGSLTSLDLSSFDTSNVTNMEWMFAGCLRLTSLNVSSFNTLKVMSMNRMFAGCSNLNSLNLSKFNTSSVTDMTNMFHNCSSLTSLDLSSFNTSKVTTMERMFDLCCSLTSLDLSNFTFEKTPIVQFMLNNVGNNAEIKPIPVKVTADGYTYLTQTTTNCGISTTAAKFVKPNGTDWVAE